MKIDCNIDGKTLTLSLNSNKPLSLILKENLASPNASSHCKGKMCGLCAVLIDGKAELACMVPAFELKGKTITTFDAFQKSRDMKDIAKAYEAVGVEPCHDCYASRSIFFQSLLQSGETRPDEIKRMLKAVRCNCIESEDEVAVVMKAMEIRRKRNVRRS
ncbi:MAG: ferredoxin [Spirochaetales bacterium]|nr:ferredoxin [Candidatus Physcosoma equi]